MIVARAGLFLFDLLFLLFLWAAGLVLLANVFAGVEVSSAGM